VKSVRAAGALVVVVGIQLSAPGLYLPPVFREENPLSFPPQTIISLPVHTALWEPRAAGAFVVVVAVQLFVPGLYFPPVFMKKLLDDPAQMIISLPVQIAV